MMRAKNVYEFMEKENKNVQVVIPPSLREILGAEDI